MQQTVDTEASGRFRAIRVLCGIYLAATVVTIGFLAWRDGDPALVTQEAWVHGIILLVFAVVLVLVAKRAEAGNRRAYLRLRIVGLIIPIAGLVEALIPASSPAGCGSSRRCTASSC